MPPKTGPTAETVRALFAHLAGDHPERFFDRVADDVRWTVLGTHPLAGVYPSKAAFRAGTFARLATLFDAPLRLATRAVFVDGDTAIVELSADATTKHGVRFDNDDCWICRFDGDAIVEVRADLDSAMVAEAIARG